MGAERLIPLALVAVLAAGCQGSENADTTSTTTGRAAAVVEWVNDGDTLTLTNGGKVRLLQIDAPELETDCYGRAALQALIALAPKGTRVSLAADPSARRQGQVRPPAALRLRPGANVNVELVRAGAASPYFFRKERGEYADELLDAVDEARRGPPRLLGLVPGVPS